MMVVCRHGLLPAFHVPNRCRAAKAVALPSVSMTLADAASCRLFSVICRVLTDWSAFHQGRLRSCHECCSHTMSRTHRRYEFKIYLSYDSTCGLQTASVVI